MKKLLVTTAIEDTWGADEHIVFLGEWCRQYDRKKIWSKRSHEVLPFIWTDRQKFENDYLYLEDLYERVLDKFCIVLNDINNTNHKIKYWRMIIGPWLLIYISILWERWESLQYIM